MRPLASLADYLTELGGPTGGGLAVGGVFGFLLGTAAQAWIADRTVPIDRWVMWGSGIGGVVGLVAGLGDQ